MIEHEMTEIEEILADLGGIGRTPLHRDHDIAELICKFTLNYFRKQPNPPLNILGSILQIAGFEEPCDLQQILKDAIAPFADDFKDTKFAKLYGDEIHTFLIRDAFADKEIRLVNAVSTAIKKALQSQIFEKPESERMRFSGFYRRLQDIADLFDLSDEEKEICAFAIVKLAYNEFVFFDHHLTADSRTYFSVPDGFERTGCFADFFTFEKATFDKLTSPDSKLFRLGIIRNGMEFSPDLNDYILARERPGHRDCYYLRDYFFRYHKAGLKPFSQTGLTENQLETIKAIIEARSPGQNINILVESTDMKPAAEFITCLAEALGHKLLQVAEPEESYALVFKNTFMVQAIWVAQKHAVINEKIALLIDKADTLLDKRFCEDDGSYFGATGTKYRIKIMTELLTGGGVVQFWLTASLADVDPYIRHLFDYAFVPVADGFAERLDFWQKTVEKYSLADVIDLEDIKRFSARFRLDVGLIDTALRNANNLLKNGWKKRRLFQHIEALLDGNSQMDAASTCVTSALPDAGWLVAPEHLNIEPEADFKLLLDALKHSQQQLKPEGFRVAILISGQPGTGKTFLARYIADVLNRKLILKTAGSVLDKWVGETEKSIKQAFDDAQRAGSVLFFDEVDSLLTTREKAIQQWEISQVNEMLSGLDNFRGVFIAATNFETVLDKASLRRFSFHFHLGSLKPQGNAIFYKTMLMPFATGKMTRAETKQLAELNDLTPSDFGSLRQRLELLPGVKKSHAELLKGLKERRNLRLNKKPAEIAVGDDAKYLLTNPKKKG